MVDQMFSSSELEELKISVRDRLSNKRFDHTLGVVRAARRLGEIFLPDKVSELVAAALLHDIAKEVSKEESAALITSSGVALTSEDFSITPIHHSIAGRELIKQSFSNFATNDILDAVYNHTLGDASMNLFCEIIFVSDYIEDGRSYYFSITIREDLFSSIESKDTYEDKVKALHTVTYKILEHTIESLTQQSRPVHSKALLTKNHFASLI